MGYTTNINQQYQPLVALIASSHPKFAGTPRSKAQPALHRMFHVETSKPFSSQWGANGLVIVEVSILDKDILVVKFGGTEFWS